MAAFRAPSAVSCARSPHACAEEALGGCVEGGPCALPFAPPSRHNIGHANRWAGEDLEKRLGRV